MLIADGKPSDARTALSLSSHCDMCVRKELPFAGYSVVKELRLRPSGFGATSRTAARQFRLRPAKARLACLAEVRLRVALFTPHFGGTKASGEYRARTGDLLVANQALSQLS